MNKISDHQTDWLDFCADCCRRELNYQEILDEFHRINQEKDKDEIWLQNKIQEWNRVMNYFDGIFAPHTKENDNA